ncbi:MAG: winged helix-turn-helix domain-containing protein [Actinomycetota bacterium]
MESHLFLEFSLFGGVRVWGPDKRELRLGRKQCQALSLLMLSPGSVVSPDVLIDFLWGERLPANPQNSLQDVIKRLRLVLEDSDRTVIVTRGGGYSLEVDPDLLDVEVFRRLATAGLRLEKGEPMAARLLLQRALENSRGDLPDISPEFRASERVDELYDLRAAATQALHRIDLVEDQGRELPEKASAVWSLGDRPVGMALSIRELGELALADLVGTVTRFGGRIHQSSWGLLTASFAQAGGALRAVDELTVGSHRAAPGLMGGVIRHLESVGNVNDIDQLLEPLANATHRQILVSDDVYQSGASGRLRDSLVPLDDRHWQFCLE